MKKIIGLFTVITLASAMVPTSAKADWADGACIAGTWTCIAMQWVADWWVGA